MSRLKRWLIKLLAPDASYHDVLVIVNGKWHAISDSYGYELTCRRVSGWRLWWKPLGTEEVALVGGEFDSEQFEIWIAGMKVCG